MPTDCSYVADAFGGPGHLLVGTTCAPNFGALLDATPVTDGAMMGLQLVTEPRLQLKRVTP